MNADSIKIECEEDGFWAVVQLDEEIPLYTNEGVLRFRITDPETLYNAVRAEIRPWLYERDQARHVFLCTPDESANMAQSLTDIWRDELGPKHPEFHSVHADIWDTREGK